MRLLILLLVALSLPAAVTKIHVVDRVDLFEGKAAPYEQIQAKAYFALDPKLPANKIITDLEFAKPGADGKVTFSADVFILRPRDPAKANGTILFEVSNRGGRGALGMFQNGDAWLLEQGYTVLWVGWQWDVPVDPKLLRVYPPLAEGVTAMIRSELVPHSKVTRMSLGDRNMVAYAASGPVTLTVRDSRDGKRQVIPTGWTLNAEKTAIEMASGFQAYQIYEAVYPTKNPVVSGTGLAAVRDVISFLKYENRGDTLLGDQYKYLKRAVGYGTSQSGRMLRQFLYDGFNSDEKGRKVFEGIWAHVAGAGRGSFNIRGAQPSRDGHPTFNYFYPSDIFPFSDVMTRDPETDKADGLLMKVSDPPKLFLTNGSYEYWGRNAALTHVTPDGKRDLELAPTTRAYFYAGTQHGAGVLPPRTNGLVNPANTTDARPFHRALLTAMVAWIKDGVAPPPSKVPHVEKGELVAPELLAMKGWPNQVMRAWRADYTSEPPKLGKQFPILVPQVDAQGIEMGGLAMPEVAVPIATYTGWNYAKDPNAPRGFVADMIGSTLVYPKAKAEQMYGSKGAYQEKVRAKAMELVAQRYLLAGDVEKIVWRAGHAWDTLLSSK
jgi:hypothetical protein